MVEGWWCRFLFVEATVTSLRFLKPTADTSTRFTLINMSAIGGQGVHNFWGFSPALDLQEVHASSLQQFYASRGSTPDADVTAPLNVLLLAPADPRSVIKTICQRFRHTMRPIHVRMGNAAPF
jgi:hypothetical protein